MIERGRVTAVEQGQLGSELLGSTPVGTEIVVTDAADFDEDGGTLLIVRQSDLYQEYHDFIAVDDDSGTITLADTTLDTFDDGDVVTSSPPAYERYAHVRINDEADEEVLALVPHSLFDRLPEGIRDVDQGLGEAVLIEEVNEEWVVLDVLGTYPDITLAFSSLDSPDGSGEKMVDFTGAVPTFGAISVASLELSETIVSVNTESRNLYVDYDNGDGDNDGFEPILFGDTFPGSASNGWGTSDSGHTWTILAGTASHFSKTGGKGVVAAHASSSYLISGDGAGGAYDELLFKFQADKVPGSQSLYVGAAFRIRDADNFYNCRVEIPAGGGALISEIRKVVGGSGTSIDTATSTATYAINTDFWIRARVYQVAVGDVLDITLQVKTWQDGSSEPADWDVDTTDDDVSLTPYAGRLGVRVQTDAISNANITVKVDELAQAVLDEAGNEFVDSLGPMDSITTALASISPYNSGQIVIVVRGDAAVAVEDFDISSFVGSGSIIIDGQGQLNLLGTVEVVGCSHFTSVQNMQLTDSGGGSPASTIDVNVSRYAEFHLLTVQTDDANSGKTYTVRFQQGSTGRVDGCQLDGASYAVRAAEASQVELVNNQGSGSSGSHWSSASIIYESGTRPTGSENQTTGGQIFGSATPTAGSSGGGTGTKTHTWRSNKSGSYQEAFGGLWRSDNDNVYEGSYGFGNHWGLWVLPDAIATALAGHTLKAMYITIRRLGQGGSSQAEPIYLYSTTKADTTGGAPSITNGPVNIGTLAWGQTKTFRIPSGIAADIKAGKNVGMRTGDGSPYVICAGRREYDNSGAIRATYSA